MTRNREEQLEMMQEPDRWALWPQLPVKRIQGGMLQTGVVVESGTRALAAPPLVNPWVEIRNLFDAETKNRIVYPSFEALYDDGWRID